LHEFDGFEGTTTQGDRAAGAWERRKQRIVANASCAVILQTSLAAPAPGGGACAIQGPKRTLRGIAGTAGHRPKQSGLPPRLSARPLHADPEGKHSRVRTVAQGRRGAGPGRPHTSSAFRRRVRIRVQAGTSESLCRAAGGRASACSPGRPRPAAGMYRSPPSPANLPPRGKRIVRFGNIPGFLPVESLPAPPSGFRPKPTDLASGVPTGRVHAAVPHDLWSTACVGPSKAVLDACEGLAGG